MTDDEPLTYDGLPVEYETTLVTDPRSGITFSTPNSKQSQLYAHCDRCKRRRPIDKLAHSGPVYECIDADECYQSQRRQGFINGT